MFNFYKLSEISNIQLHFAFMCKIMDIFLIVFIVFFPFQIMNQADSYLTWVNSQLNKRPDSRHVNDLSKDMKDGVIFLQLVEVISKFE